MVSMSDVAAQEQLRNNVSSLNFTKRSIFASLSDEIVHYFSISLSFGLRLLMRSSLLLRLSIVDSEIPVLSSYIVD